jgi:hypothetical protein
VLAPMCSAWAAVSVGGIGKASGALRGAVGRYDVGIREEVQASTAAHRDLGSGYDAAVAEGLVERIGEEIDRRVDARLFGHVQAPAPAPPPRRAPAPGRIGVAPVFLALGSMGLAIGGTVAVLHPGDGPPTYITFGQGVLVALIWIVVGAVNIAYARRN